MSGNISQSGAGRIKVLSESLLEFLLRRSLKDDKSFSRKASLGDCTEDAKGIWGVAAFPL